MGQAVSFTQATSRKASKGKSQDLSKQKQQRVPLAEVRAAVLREIETTPPQDVNGWVEVLKKLLPPSNNSPLLEQPAELSPYLYLGDGIQADNPGLLQPESAKITCVICCHGKEPTRACQYEADLTCHILEAEDLVTYPLLQQDYATFSSWMDAARGKEGKVFVHCEKGINRSAALCTAYLIEKERIPLTQAVMHVHDKRPIVLQNAAFLGQLVEFSEKLGLLR